MAPKQGAAHATEQNTGDTASMAFAISTQVLEGLMPAITTAITTAITNAVPALAMQISANIVPTVLNQVTPVMEKQSLLLKYEIDRLGQYSRRETVRVVGLPETEDESETTLRSQIVLMAAKCNADIQEADISVCHRTGKKGAKPRAVLC